MKPIDEQIKFINHQLGLQTMIKQNGGSVIDGDIESLEAVLLTLGSVKVLADCIAGVDAEPTHCDDCAPEFDCWRTRELCRKERIWVR